MDEPCCAKAASGGRYDLVVIGAGSAGFSAAITAAEAGARVALIGHGTLGGTCVNVGCVPSKTLIRAADSLHQARAASRFAGIRANAALADWAELAAQKDDLVASLRQAKYADLIDAYPGLSYIEGKARLVAGGVAVDGHVITSPRAIIATGARPAIPAIPGIEDIGCLTSTTALALPALPRSLLIIGGGYVGAELAQMFARAGVAVTVVCRSRLLPAAEPEIGEALARYFADEDIRVIEGITYGSIERIGAGVRLRLARQGEPEAPVTAERVLAAAGRRPNTDGLCLTEAGIAVGPGGGVAVDERMRTSREGIYAAGDVTGRDPFVYMAAYGAKIAARNALDGDRLTYDNGAMPAVIFTDPQVASVGLTEQGAREAGYGVKTRVLPLDQVPRALAARDTRGLIKLVADADSNRLLGAHVLAPEGADSIGAAALALRHGMTVQALADTIFPYLTTVEGLKLAAQAFDRDVAMLSCCAG